MPTSEPLLIMVNAQVVTNKIRFETIGHVGERGNRVSTFRCTIDDAASLGIAQWNNIMVYSADMATVYFNGFVMTFKTAKRGIFVDYTIDCSSVEVLLQKAIINGSFSDTDDNILAGILANGYPDQSDWFDWVNDITAFSLSDLGIDFQGMTLLDALEALSAKAGGAPYSQSYNDSANINLIKNPAIANNLNFYGGVMPADSFHFDASWNSANVIWISSGGGSIEITSQLNIPTPGVQSGYFRIGRSTDADDLNNMFHIHRADNKWLNLSFRLTHTNSSSLPVQVNMVTYTEDGTFFGSTTLQDTSVGPGFEWWSVVSTGDGAFDLSDPTKIPDSGWAEFSVRIFDNAAPVDAFVTQVQKCMLEVVHSVGNPGVIPTYFDGTESSARWLGTAHNSASIKGANPLEWGTSPDAAFDLDLGNMNEIVEDFQFNFNGLDGINSIIVDGGFQYTSINWEYPAHGNAANTHFDLEVTVFPADTLTFPIIYVNDGTDETPVWSTKTVADRSDNFDTAQVLYDQERHWVEFFEAPPDLDRSWRITGRIKEPIRVIVQDSESVAAKGVEMTAVINIDTVTTPAAAFDFGSQELARRKPTANYSFTTYEPGLVAGAEIDIVDSLQSINDTALIIQRVTKKYLGGGKVKSTVEVGQFVPGLEDILTENYNVTKPKLPVGTDQTSVAVGLLVDQDGSVLTDQDGNQLLDIA